MSETPSPPSPGVIDAILAQRGTRYGKFEDHARIAQDLKDVMKETPNWNRLTPDQKEALEMVAHKIGRILNGDPNYGDSWDDISGYSKLVGDRLREEAARPVQTVLPFGPMMADSDPNATT